MSSDLTSAQRLGQHRSHRTVAEAKQARVDHEGLDCVETPSRYYASEAIQRVRTLGPHRSWLFTLEIEFFTLSLAMDLDNLPKPILDTLFRPGVDNSNRDHLAEVTAIVFLDADDARVMQLNLRKMLVHEAKDEGVMIQVFWTDDD
jgi:hypothetical protein